MKTIMKMLTLGVLVAVVVGVCGCTSPIQNPLAPTSKINDYANNYVTYTKAHTSAGYTVTSTNIQQNGTDAVQLTIVTTGRGNSSTTAAWNIKEFSNVNDATAFFNSITFGYTPSDAATMHNMTIAGNPYELTFGHNPSTTRGAYKIGLLNFVQMSASGVWQQDEFVIWGDVTAIGLSTGSTSTSTSTSTQDHASVSNPSAAVATTMPRLATVTSIDAAPVAINPGQYINIRYHVMTMAGTADPGKGATGATRWAWGGGQLGTGYVSNGEGLETISSAGLTAEHSYSIVLEFIGNAQYYPSSAVFTVYVNIPSTPTTPNTPIATPTVVA